MRFLGERFVGRPLPAPLLLLAVLACAASAPARAQPPTDAELRAQDPAADPEEGQKKLGSDIKKMLREAQPLSADDKTKFDGYFNRYYFQLIKATKDPPKFRQDLRNQYFRPGKKGPPYERLNGLVRGMMQKYIAGDFPPPIKCNAVLVLGELNEEEPPPATPARPWAAAQKDLLALVSAPKTPDAVKAGALVGLMRSAEWHAKSPLPADVVAALIDAALPLVSQGTPPAGRSAAGHEWLRQSAIGVLGALGQTGPNQSVLKALAAVLVDPQAAVKTRGAAARALGKLNYGSVQADGPALAAALELLLADGCGGELQRAEDRAKEPSKRRIWSLLVDVQLAIKGLRTAVAEGSLTPLETRVKTLSQHAEKGDWDKFKQELDKIERPAAPAAAPK